MNPGHAGPLGAGGGRGIPPEPGAGRGTPAGSGAGQGTPAGSGGGRDTAPQPPSPRQPPSSPQPRRAPAAPSAPPAHRRAPGRPARLLARIVSGPLAWAGGTGSPAPDGSTTARDLALRHRLLLALSALLTLSLFVSYQGVHGDANPLRTSTAPTVLSLDTALYALGEAQRDAARPVPTSDFQKQISVAVQSLAAAAADDDLAGPAGRQALQTVAGLITVYAVKVQQSQLRADDDVLRKAYLSYATGVLTEKGSGIRARLKDLQRRQRATVHRQTSFGPLLWLAWGATLLLALVLTAALLETQRFLRHRFRRRYNRQLLAAGLLTLAGLAVTVLFTVWTHAGMSDTRTLLDRPLSGPHIPEAGRHTASYLAGTGFRAAASVWILIGGVLLMALAETGLRRHINDYRFRPR